MVVHVYVYCYPSITAWNLNLEVTDRILVNFNNTTGIFNCILWTKLLAVTLLAISCLGTHGVKGEKITWPKIYAALVAGCVLFFLNWWLLDLSLPHMTSTILYVITLTAGYLGLLMAGLWMSRLYRHNLMDDVFNIEKRILPAGNPVVGERVFRQPADQVRVSGQGMGRMDQRCKRFSCVHRAWNTG